MENKPLSQQFFEAAQEWVELEAAASMMEDCKSAVLAQAIVAQGPDIAVNRAETTAKAAPDWKAYCSETVEKRKASNLAKVKMEYMKMRFNEWTSTEANARVEARL